MFKKTYAYCMHSMYPLKISHRTSMVIHVTRDCKIRTIRGLITPAVPIDDLAENYVRTHDYFSL